MAKIYSARQAGEEMDLPHLEVIRRLRRGDIEGRKLGWNWVITQEGIERAKQSDWYQKHIARKLAS